MEIQLSVTSDKYGH